MHAKHNVFRITRRELHKPKFVQCLLAQAYVTIMELRPCSDDHVGQLQKLDVRITRKSIWTSRHVEAFGPRMGLSLAQRLLRAYSFPGLWPALSKWLGSLRLQRTQRRKTYSAAISLRRKVRQLKLSQLFGSVPAQPVVTRTVSQLTPHTSIRKACPRPLPTSVVRTGSFLRPYNGHGWAAGARLLPPVSELRCPRTLFPE